MGAQTRLLAALVALLCIHSPAYGAETCGGFRHLENGRTFFRYAGLLVIFRCDLGYKLHGYQTNSCVSGHWSREPPVCVGSGCPSPGPLLHGVSSVNEDGSWVVFSCSSGFRLYGPSMLYCKGHTWNSTKPVCKESDMMSSVSHPDMQKPNPEQTVQDLQAPSGLKNQLQTRYPALANTASKEAYLKVGLLSPQTSNSEEVKVTNQKIHLKQHIQALLKDGVHSPHQKAHIQKGIEVSVTKPGRDEGSMKQSSVLPDKGTGINGSAANPSLEETEEVGKGIEALQMPLTPATQTTTKSHISPTVSPTLSLLSGVEGSTSPPSLLRAATSAVTASTHSTTEPTPAAETQASKSQLTVLGGEKVLAFLDHGGVSVPDTSQDRVTFPAIVTGPSAPTDGSPLAESVLRRPAPVEGPRQRGSVTSSAQGQQPWSEGEEELAGTTLLHPGQIMTEPPDVTSTDHQPKSTHHRHAYTLPLPFTLTPSKTSSFSSSTFSSADSSYIPLPSLSASGHSSTRSNAIAPLSDVTFPSHTSTPTQQKPYWTENHNNVNNVTVKPPALTLILNRRPVCPYPPIPAHGTFYFRNVENPGPREYRHYIQYACYPGYTLAHGDIHSYCQQGATWSGVTPVCLELTPCSVNNGGCSQLCSHSQNHNQSHIQTQPRTQCHCRPGFTLLDDKRTCRDLDECVEGQHQCQQKCVNTFGSFKCCCDDGYQQAHDQTSCTDVDECLLPVAVTGCVFGCVNTPGSFHCQCPAGYSLRSADGLCRDLDECAVNQGRGPCMEQCHNSPGSYRCSCTHGHTLAGDGLSCIAQCPPGYSHQPLIAPENSTTHTPKEECVDIDECKDEELKINRCEWRCVNLPGSYRCICPRGYTLQTDKHCTDINECSRRNGGCSHLCVNHKGGYKCACPASHRLSPYSWKKCVPRKTLEPAG